MSNYHDMLSQIDAYQVRINDYRPFGDKLLPQIKDYYRVGLTYTSSALEGISYTESETKVLLEDGLTAGGRPLRDALAIQGHAKAFDYMFSLLRETRLSSRDFLRMHEFLQGGLESGSAGEYRSCPVFITGSRFSTPSPGRIEQEMKALDDWLENQREAIHPVTFAVQLHKRLVFIHPFEDGNGRVSRLAMNTALIQKGYLPLIIPPVIRSEYIQNLETAHLDDGPYMKFMARREIESQREMLRLLEENCDHQEHLHSDNHMNLT